MQPRDRYLRLGGLRFHYREWGEPTSPPLVVLHGILAEAHTYDGLCRGLSRTRHVFALDQRGHGETEHAEDYSWPQWVEDGAAFSAALSLAPFDLVAHSTGANIAARFAGKNPSLLCHLV